VTQQVSCAKCGGPVTLFLTVWGHDEPAKAQTWKCPHCHEANNGSQLPGKVGQVLARESDPPQPKRH
jgi:hypothetical protein